MEALAELLEGKIESIVRKATAPQGWSYAAIGDLCTLINGRAFKPSDWTNTGLPIIRIQNLNNPDAKFNHFLGNVEPKFLVDNGELLFAWSGTPGTSFGAHIWTGGRAVLNQHIFRVLLDEKVIDKTFFKIAINQKLQELIDKAHGGVGLRHVTKGKFEQTEILLPPRNEQPRIVAKIEVLKARSQGVKEELEAIPALLDQFRQSVLAAAFRGDLTADWREKKPDIEPASELWEQIKQQISTLDKFNTEFVLNLDEYHLPNLPDSWIWLNVASLSSVKGGKRLPKGESLVDEDTGYPYIKAGNLKNGTVILDELQYIPAHIQPSIKNYIVSAGDVYITIVGACIGDAGIIPNELDGANLTENAAKICDIRGCKNQYLALWLRSPSCQEIIRTKILSAAQGKLALSRIKTIPVPLPPEKEQVEIIKKIELLFNNADRIEQQYKETKAYLDQLDRSILAKAFRGELVPQDPNDEPASVLLERIRAEREKLDTKKKAKGKTEKKSGKAKPEAAEPKQLSLPGFE